MRLSRSALSRAIYALGARLGARLLTRTTRSVSTTEADVQLLGAVVPWFDEVGLELGALTALQDEPAGAVRITARDYAITTVHQPRLLFLPRDYPDIHIEFSVNHAFTDIAAQYFDTGVHAGDRVDKRMMVVRLALERDIAVAASPG